MVIGALLMAIVAPPSDDANTITELGGALARVSRKLPAPLSAFEVTVRAPGGAVGDTHAEGVGLGPAEPTSWWQAARPVERYAGQREAEKSNSHPAPTSGWGASAPGAASASG